MICSREGCNSEVGVLYTVNGKQELPYCEKHWFETSDKELLK